MTFSQSEANWPLLSWPLTELVLYRFTNLSSARNGYCYNNGICNRLEKYDVGDCISFRPGLAILAGSFDHTAWTILYGRYFLTDRPDLAGPFKIIVHPFLRLDLDARVLLIGKFNMKTYITVEG